LFGETVGVGRSLERFDGQQCRCLVVSMAGALVGWEPRDDDVRLELPDDPYGVGEYALPIPDVEGLFGSFREAEVNCRRKELLPPIDFARFEQFVSTDKA